MHEKTAIDDRSCEINPSDAAAVAGINFQELRLGPYAVIVDACLQAWDRADLSRRIWQKDPTVWNPNIVAV